MSEYYDQVVAASRRLVVAYDAHREIHRLMAVARNGNGPHPSGELSAFNELKAARHALFDLINPKSRVA